MKSFKFIDLFCGLGGFRIGMEKYGGECVFSSDIDEKVSKVYKENFNEDPLCDITTIKAKDVPDHDLLCAGFPCQAFSIGGYRKGFEDTRGTLFFDVLRILKEKQPKVCFLENVRGLTNHDGGNTINVIRKKLDIAGYKINEDVLNVYNYGLPQNRERWYCVGFRKDLKINQFNFPKKVQLKFFLEDIIDTDEKEHSISKIALGHVEKNAHSYHKRNGSKLDIFDNSKRFTIVTEARRTRASIRNDGISPCLTAKMGTGGNNVPIIYELKRKFTVRECLDLMGFPKKYKIRDNYQQSYKQIGNSVCVKIVDRISKNIIQALEQ